MYYSSGNYEAFARPPPARGRGKQAGLHYRHAALRRPDGGVLSCARRPDARREHPHPGDATHRAGGGLRRLGIPGAAAMHHARRPRDGQPLRGDVGSVPLHPLHRDPPDVSVLDEYYWLNKRDPNYSLMPRHGGSRPGRPHRQEVRPVRQGLHGDHAPVLHPGRGAATTSAITEYFSRRGAELELLALLAHHVRL